MNKKIIIIILLLSTVMVWAESGITIQPMNGSEVQYAISIIGQIRFNSGILYLYDQEGSELGHTALAELGKIGFNETQDYPSSLSVPVPIDQTMRIFDMQGHLILRVPSQTDAYTIPVNLPSGVYILQTGAEIVKFVKK